MNKDDSWLYSDSFLKRAFAIWGYAAVAHLLIAFGIFVVLIIIGLTMGVSTLRFGQ